LLFDHYFSFVSRYFKNKKVKSDFRHSFTLKKSQQMRFFVFLDPIPAPHFCIVGRKYLRHLIQSIMQKHLYILLFSLLSFAQAKGQGWERIYGGSGQDVAKGLAATPDGGYILTGYYNGNSRLYLIKTDGEGKLQWSKTFFGPQGSSRIEGFSVTTTLDGGYAVVGYVDNDGAGPQKKNIYLLKTDAFGEKIWDKIFGGILDEEGRAIAELADGSLVITGVQNITASTENVFVLKTDSEGNSLWFNNFGQAQYKKKGLALALASNGDIVVAGEYWPTPSEDKDTYVLRVSGAGAFVWEQIYAGPMGTLGDMGEEEARAIVAAPDGNFVLAGVSSVEPGGEGVILKIAGNGDATPIWQKLFIGTNFFGLARTETGILYATGSRTVGPLERMSIFKLDPEGNTTWEAVVGHGGIAAGYAVVPAKGGVVIAGFTEPFVIALGESYAYLVKADNNGRVQTSYIEANIFRDFNANCTREANEPALRNWIAKIEGPYDTVYTVANAQGDIRVDVDTGNYRVVLFPPNPYWKTCDSVLLVQIPNFYDTVQVSLPARTIFDCPRNEVDVMTPVLRRCADNVYGVRYCNSGTVPSDTTKIEVTLDPALTFVSSSLTAIPLGDNRFSFNIGLLNNGDCGNFSITAYLDCDSEIGQAHCVAASISPRQFCETNSGWDGAIVAARAFCENDSVKMLLENIGTGNMGEALGYVIAEDVVMLTQPGDEAYRFQLDAGQDSLVWSHPANGSTFRIIAEQSAGYPGTSYPTAAIEGCLSDTSTSEVSLGFYTMYPEDDADAFIETDCQETYDTDFNPISLKRGHPKGYDVAHYISPRTDLDFLIQFQNTTADTVQQVIVRDTLSAALDPATVYPGAASHPYQFDILGNGIVQFTLSNLNLLPGSGTQSEGFVKFRVSQKPNLPCETTIFNRAATSFDFGAPVFSSETFHTVCEFDSFIIVTNTKEIFVPGADLQVYPNPASESVAFDLKGVAAQSFILQLFDIQGRLIVNLSEHHPFFRLYQHQLPAGELFYRLAADGKPVASGKLIVVR
jgi:hypothetical protein